MFAIPNRVAAGVKVASYTNFPHLRLDIDVTVGVNEDLGRVRALLLGLVAPERGFMATPGPEVIVTALNDYNVALQLRVWIEDERTHIKARAALREAVYVCLTEAGVDMPFETLEVRSAAK
jgi:small conductance mechanosensitive channel